MSRKKKSQTSEAQELRSKLNAETAQIPWRELQTWFASGNVVQVQNEVNLLDVAEAMAKDSAEDIQQWMLKGQVATVADQQAADWLEQDVLVWAVVVRPFVIVQAVEDHSSVVKH